MAFQIRNISVLSYANGFTHWHYKTSDDIDTINSEGYFNSIFDMVNIGDVIIINPNINQIEKTGQYVFNKIASSITITKI
jgi:hypothetical protein